MEKEIKEAQTQARIQIIEEIRRWHEQGTQSVHQLCHRVHTLTITFDPLRLEKQAIARDERNDPS